MVWTIVLALVFSAGLITGQRVVSANANGPEPLVALSSQRVDTDDQTPSSKAKAAKAAKAASKPKDVEFSFYNRLDKKKASAKKRTLGDAVSSALGGAASAKTALPARYTLQVGAHDQLSRAKKQMSKLSDKGVEPSLESVNVPGKSKMHKVRVGKFHSLDEARHFQAELQRTRNIKTFVTPL